MDKVDPTIIKESTLPQTPPWIIKNSKVILELNELTKTQPSTYQEKFHTILLYHPNHLYIFTDGSKDNNKTACAAIINKNNSQESSIFTAEAHAIDLALNIISKSKHKKFIFSDSLCLTIIKK